MARPRLEIGALGEISARLKETNGKKFWVAESAMRLDGGVKKRLSARGSTKAAALAALHKKAEKLRNDDTPLKSTAPTVRDALKYYLDTLAVVDPNDPDIRDANAVRQQTFRQYVNDATNLNVVMGDLELQQLTVPLVQKRLESLMDRATGEGATRARQAKGTLNRALAEAVRMGELATNPVLSVKLPRKGVRVVEALDQGDLKILREILEARFAEKKPGPKPSRRVLHAIELMLSTGCRIGEVLAIRWRDVDIETKTVVISGTVIDRTGVFRQGYTKTDRFHSLMSLTDRAVHALKEAKAGIKTPITPDSPVFPTRSGRFSAPSTVRGSLRRILESSTVKLPGNVTPHAFRRAVATALADTVGVEAAAAQLRHKSSRTTQQHYIRRSEVAKDRTSILEEL